MRNGRSSGVVVTRSIAPGSSGSRPFRGSMPASGFLLGFCWNPQRGAAPDPQQRIGVRPAGALGSRRETLIGAGLMGPGCPARARHAQGEESHDHRGCLTAQETERHCRSPLLGGRPVLRAARVPAPGREQRPRQADSPADVLGRLEDFASGTKESCVRCQRRADGSITGCAEKKPRRQRRCSPNPDCSPGPNGRGP
jgi:hypothetical protein